MQSTFPVYCALSILLGLSASAQANSEDPCETVFTDSWVIQALTHDNSDGPSSGAEVLRLLAARKSREFQARGGLSSEPQSDSVAIQVPVQGATDGTRAPHAVSMALADRNFRNFQLKGPRRKEARVQARIAGGGSNSDTSEPPRPPKAPELDPRWKDVEVPGGIVGIDQGPDGAVGISSTGDRIYFARPGEAFQSVAKVVEHGGKTWTISFQGNASKSYGSDGLGIDRIRAVTYRDGVIYAFVRTQNSTSALMMLDINKNDISTFQYNWSPPGDPVHLKVDSGYFYMALRDEVYVYQWDSKNKIGSRIERWSSSRYSVRDVPIRQISALNGRVAILQTIGDVDKIFIFEVKASNPTEKWVQSDRSKGDPTQTVGISLIAPDRLLIINQGPGGTTFIERGIDGSSTPLNYPSAITRWSYSPESGIFYWGR